jgi:hypothetical protein
MGSMPQASAMFAQGMHHGLQMLMPLTFGNNL